MTRFITKGTVSAALGVLAFVLSMSGHSKVASFLRDPDTLQNIMLIVGSGLTLYAGISQGIHPTAPPQPISPPTPEDPYPGYDFDPIRGWVKVGD